MESVYYIARGNISKFHHDMCSLWNVPSDNVNKRTLYTKAQRGVDLMKKLRKFPDKKRYNNLCASEFVFPKANDDKCKRSIDEQDEKSPKKQCVINNQSCIIEKLRNDIKVLKDKLRNLKLYRLNEKMKRKDIANQSLRKKVIDLQCKLKEKTSKTSSKYTQCDLQNSKVKEILKENDKLKDLLDEINNNQDDVEDEKECKIIDFRLDTKGRPYSAKLRQVFYEFRSRNVGVEHISPLINSVLSLVNTTAVNLPSKSSAALLTCELGIIGRQHIKEEIKTSDNISMLRDGTTKKGHHFYGVEISTNQKIITAGLREVHDGKASTYVDCVNEIIGDIEGEDKSIEVKTKVKNFMTDRCATEAKVNKILTSQFNNKDHDYLSTDSNKQEPNSFKCGVHPLLQMSDVCIKEIQNLEKVRALVMMMRI
ncbi:hypothetical protein FSP39_008756 [Pinctada imbricata]|uniref:Uncharacterized protein n=1 Tax=Pinctada imbricata TaxID=66713 RepID=A0AA88XJN6_PINIB|nr:hypothetical protein FSP39_008756 [Pinctada imbricata]